jgi:hypothetical protein
MSQRFARSFALAARRSAVMLTARTPLHFNLLQFLPAQRRLFASTNDFSDAETSLNANALPLKQFYALCDTALDGIQNRLELPDLDIPAFESELTVRVQCASICNSFSVSFLFDSCSSFCSERRAVNQGRGSWQLGA